MGKIITETAEDFIKKIIEIIGNGGFINEMEDAALREAKNCAARLLGAYAESVDAAIAADKAARRMQGLVGEVTYKRTYYKKASGGYEYLADTVLGVGKRARVSEGLSLSLVKTAKDMSYGKASRHITDGEISRQTVMGKVRLSRAAKAPPEGLRRVPELHIDADEAHITQRKLS